MTSNRFLRTVRKGLPGIRNFSQNVVRLRPILSADYDRVEDRLKVGFSDGKFHEFPSLFLQDNCTCEKCFHPSSQSRLCKLIDLDMKNKIRNVEFNKTEVKCIWDDGHEGIFNESWLKTRRFTEDNINLRKATLRDNQKLVGADYKMQREDFDDVLTKDSSLLNVLTTLCNTGVFLIENAPRNVGKLRKLADVISFIRLTHYGYEFTVKSEKNAVNLAYTSTKLGVHTDLPYYVYPPGTQLLHCIKQFEGDGGNSHLVDGFLIAEQMRSNYPNHFHTLCTVPVEFYDIGKDYTEFHKIHHSPTFVLNPETNSLNRIVYSNQTLSSFLPIPLDKVLPLYEALKVFTDLCYKPENLMEFKLKEGDVLFFDNWRFLHGREGFDPNAGDRHLEGCYIDWDEIFSRIRVLQNKRNLKENIV